MTTVFVIWTKEHGPEGVAPSQAVAQAMYEKIKLLAAYKNISVFIDPFDMPA